MSGRRVAGVFAVALLAGCPWGTLSGDELDAAYPYNAGRMFSHGVAAGAAKALRGKLGANVRVTNVNVSPQSTLFTVQDPKAADRLDNWIYRDDGFMTPQPLEVSKDDNISARSFALDGIAFERIPEILKQAIAKLGIEQPKIEGCYVSLNNGKPEFRVDVRGPRRSGEARFTAAGELIDATVR